MVWGEHGLGPVLQPSCCSPWEWFYSAVARGGDTGPGWLAGKAKFPDFGHCRDNCVSRDDDSGFPGTSLDGPRDLCCNGGPWAFMLYTILVGMKSVGAGGRQ